MTDEPRDDERIDEGEAGEGDAPDAPPPRTWAGQARAGEGEASHGITEEFAGLEEELNAELEEFDTDEAGTAEEPAAEPDAADELEEPPAEFDFEEEPEAGDPDDAGEPEGAEESAAAPVGAEGDGEEAPEAEADAKTEEPPGQETVESDTLAVADREAEQEAAHAGLRARAEKTAAERVGLTTAQASVAQAVAAAPAAGAGEPPKRTIGWRFIAASFVVVASTAAATAIAFLLYLTDIGNDLKGDATFANAVQQEVTEVEGGAPQTILILGSDKRAGTGEEFGRSDTTMLLRVDPDKEFLSLLSLPRDLEVEIPGYGPDRLNAAYSQGGPELTTRTVKELLGIDINHIVNVDFEGFYDAINAIGCVYIDVDRHYFNPVGGEYDAIDIEAGYTKLCGYTALDYVRYRHNDNDLVRGARQQAFVREARQQVPPRSLLPPPFGDSELIEIFTKYTTSDIDDPPEIVEMLKSFVDIRSAPVRQVSLGKLTANSTGVGASKEDVEVAVNQFLGNDLEEESTEPAPAKEPEAPAEKKDEKPEEEAQEPSAPAVIDVTGESQEYASQFQNFLREKKASLPVFYPTAVIANPAAGISEESRAHPIGKPGFPPDPKEEPYYGYKYVLPYQESFGLSYYGVAGVNWTDPPILNNPSEVRRIDGRDYMLFYEKDRLRLVGWTTDDGAYWVNNTLTRALSEDAMLEVATSVREFEG